MQRKLCTFLQGLEARREFIISSIQIKYRFAVNFGPLSILDGISKLGVIWAIVWGIWFDPEITVPIFCPKRPVFFHACATCSDLPSDIWLPWILVRDCMVAVRDCTAVGFSPKSTETETKCSWETNSQRLVHRINTAGVYI